MKTLLYTILLSVGFVVISEAATITYDFGAPLVRTPTAVQVTRLTEFITDLNARRASRVPPEPDVTIEQYLDSVIFPMVVNYIRQMETKEAESACENYKAANASVRNQINTALGGKSPCP